MPMPDATSTSEGPPPAEPPDGRKRVGVALSGGVARGPAHIGALAVLERSGIPIDYVSGTSAGAIIGALFCAGTSMAQAQEMVVDFNWWTIARPVWPRRGFVSFARLEQWLINALGDVTFADLRRPFAVVTTDLDQFEPHVMRDGRVAPAVHASCAVPGFVEPVAVGDRLLGDGGVSNNLPVEAARGLGADFVIGVDLFRPTIRRRWGPLGYGAAALENYVRRSGGGIGAADCLICPDLTGESYFRFHRRVELIEIGSRAAEAQLPAIRAALGLAEPAA